VLAIDAGTSAIRVSAVALDGRVVARSALPSTTRVSGEEATLDPGRLWADVCRLIGEVVEASGVPRAIGVSAQIATLLVDEQLEPVGPVLLWQDRRAGLEAVDLAERLDGLDLTTAGRRSVPESAGARALWAQRNTPDAWDRARWLLTLKDFLVANLTGAVATDPTSASYSLLFDVSRREWSHELLAAAHVPFELLPAVLPADALSGSTTRDTDAPLPPGIPVAVGGPDGSVGALGSGACKPAVTVDIAGTTDVLVHTLDHPVLDPEGRSILNAFLLDGVWSVGGPIGLTGGALTWLSSLLGYSSLEAAYAELAPVLETMPPGAGGVRLRTQLTGERFPTWRDDRSGEITGLRPEHSAAHILRAAEEGAAFAVRQGLDALAGIGVEAGEITISGGAAKRRDTMRLRADCWGRTVVGVAVPEATTVGAAILASLVGGMYSDARTATASMVMFDAGIACDPVTAQTYDEIYASWQLEARDAAVATARRVAR
jgi:sugar (pentulose or hexulose) kinase